MVFQIDNESGIDFAVGSYWSKFIRDRAQAKGKLAQVCDSRRMHSPAPYLTTNFQDWNNLEIFVPIKNSQSYTFLDISQNCGNEAVEGPAVAAPIHGLI